MPYDVSTFTLPCGVQATKADGSGVIGREDADALMRLISPGGPNFGQPLLALTQRMIKMTPEARNIFSVPAPHEMELPWCAVVVTSPVIRVTINFLLRVSRTDQVKLFPAEPEAIAWLDGRTREAAARKTSAP